MKLSDHTTALSTAASTGTVSQFTRRLAILLVCLPLIVGAFGLAGRIPQLLPFGPTRQTPNRRPSLDQVRAAALAKRYCASLTRDTCDFDPADVTVVSTGTTPVPGRKRPLHEWNVYGRAGASHCFVGLDPDTKALRLFTRESAYTSGETSHAALSASSDNGDIGTLVGTTEERYARLYLERFGIVLPLHARLAPIPNDKDSFCYDPNGGKACTIQVSIDPADGRLIMLEDRTSRRSTHEAQDTHAPR
jgi:hypothetical protein